MVRVVLPLLYCLALVAAVQIFYLQNNTLKSIKLQDSEVLLSGKFHVTHPRRSDKGGEQELAELICLLKTRGSIEKMIATDFKTPNGQKDALSMVITEILLFQRTAAMQMKILREMVENSDKHTTMMAQMKEQNKHIWKCYMEAKTHYHWANVYLHWARWLVLHSNDLSPDSAAKYTTNYDAFCQHMYKITATYSERLRPDSEIVKRFPLASKAEKTFMTLHRRTLFSEAIRDEIWFQDALGNASLVTGKIFYLLVEGAGKSAKAFLSKRAHGYPKERNFFWRFPYDKLTARYYDSGESEAVLSIDSIDVIFDELISTEGYGVACDIVPEDTVNCMKLFEASVFYTPAAKTFAEKNEWVSPQMQAFSSPRKPPTKKGAKGTSRRGGRFAPAPAPETKQVEPETASIISVQPELVANASIIVEGRADSNADQSEKLDKVGDAKVIPIAEAATELELDSDNSNEDEEAQLLKELGGYAQEVQNYCKEAQTIRQAESDGPTLNMASQIRRSMTAELGLAPVKACKMSSADFCLAVPKADELFRTNVASGMCRQLKSKRYAWVFDETLILHRAHMVFLSRLFGLSKEGRVSSAMLKKVFYYIERGQSEGKHRPGYFQFSHKFVIGDTAYAPGEQQIQDGPNVIVPLGKGIHDEHASSRFNWIRSLSLFEGAGLDPRFFIPL